MFHFLSTEKQWGDCPTSPNGSYAPVLPPLSQRTQFSSTVTPPTITVQPTDQSMVIPGSLSTFTVTVKTIPGHEHTYQWQKNKTNISESTSSTLTISDVTRSDEATYCCIVSNAAGSVTSDPAEITVCKLNNVIVHSLLTRLKAHSH